MAVNTAIQWCDSTVNPVGGCGGCELWRKGASPSDLRCYAGSSTQWRNGKNRAFAMDFNTPELFPGRMADAARYSDLTGKPRRGIFNKPWLDGAPRVIFISDMGDALSEGPYRDAGDYATAKDKRQAKRGDLHV